MLRLLDELIQLSMEQILATAVRARVRAKILAANRVRAKTLWIGAGLGP